VTHKSLAAFFGSGPFKLLADNAASRQAGLFDGFGKPSR
jgi:hypothetical protein